MRKHTQISQAKIIEVLRKQLKKFFRNSFFFANSLGGDEALSVFNPMRSCGTLLVYIISRNCLSQTQTNET